jgi:hypothetical protein
MYDYIPDSDIVEVVQTYTPRLTVKIPLSRKRWKYGLVRDLDTITTIGIHHTSVKGGYGIAKKVKAKALAKEGGKTIIGINDDLTLRMKRYENEPYHGVYSIRDDASIIQYPAWMYTYHGNRMNSYSVGWAIDCDSRYDFDDWYLDFYSTQLKDMDSFMRSKLWHSRTGIPKPVKQLFLGEREKRESPVHIPSARTALAHFVLTMRESCPNLRMGECHSQHAAKPWDPHLPIIREILLPTFKELDITLNHSVHTASKKGGVGRPIDMELLL